MRQTFLCLVALLVSSYPGYPQSTDDSGGFTFLPGRILFQPLSAHHQEPRVGIRKEIGTSRLKLDIGSTLDLLEYKFAGKERAVLRAGIDFFTYALSTNAEGLRLQIDAVDGFFGGHLLLQFPKDRAQLSVRLRLIHLSAHFLDGHWDRSSREWKNNRDPIPFTRDYGELLGAYQWTLENLSVEVYSGFSYATLIRPDNIKRITTIHGIQLHSSSLTGDVFGRPFSLFAADNFTLVGIPSYIGTNNLEAGMKFGEWSGSGLRIYISYYNGLEMFSQYYDVRRESWGIGFAFDFW